jgi:hypothetical protein
VLAHQRAVLGHVGLLAVHRVGADHFLSLLQDGVRSLAVHAHLPVGILHRLVAIAVEGEHSAGLGAPDHARMTTAADDHQAEGSQKRVNSHVVYLLTSS